MSDIIDQSEITPEELDEARSYALVIEWSLEDDAFVVSVPDLPSLHTHGATREEAATMGDEAIAVWLSGDRALGIPIPQPEFSALRAAWPPRDIAQHVRAIRQRLNVSQQAFAEMLNVSLGTVRSWEQGVRAPDGASRRLLDIAEHQPDALLKVSSLAEAAR